MGQYLLGTFLFRIFWNEHIFRRKSSASLRCKVDLILRQHLSILSELFSPVRSQFCCITLTLPLRFPVSDCSHRSGLTEVHLTFSLKFPCNLLSGTIAQFVFPNKIYIENWQDQMLTYLGRCMQDARNSFFFQSELICS